MWKITFTEHDAEGQQIGLQHTVYSDSRSYAEACEKFTGFYDRAGDNVRIVDCVSTAKSWCD